MEVLESHDFRVTRDAELAIQELEADDLLETIEKFVRRRRFGSVIRVTVDESMPERIRGILKENLELSEQDIYTVKPPLGLSSLWDLQRIDRPELSYSPLVQATPAVLDGAEVPDIFAAIRHRDILLHHPYDSFDPVVDFVTTAAEDPDVLAIKTTLYRVGRNAPVVDALMEAAANGKQVAALLELKARFDEESNIGWAKRAGARGRARDLRPRGSQDALQDHARRASRGRPHPPLRPPRHRQLQQRHHQAVHRPRLPHLRRGPRRRRVRGLQLAHRLLHGRRLPQVPGGAGPHARAASRSASTARSRTP